MFFHGATRQPTARAPGAAAAPSVTRIGPNVTLTGSAFEAQVGDARDRHILRLEAWSGEDIRTLEAVAMEPGHDDLDAEPNR